MISIEDLHSFEQLSGRNLLHLPAPEAASASQSFGDSSKVSIFPKQTNKIHFLLPSIYGNSAICTMYMYNIQQMLFFSLSLERFLSYSIRKNSRVTQMAGEHGGPLTRDVSYSARKNSRVR